MVMFISLFFPTFISLYLIKKWRELEWKDIIFLYPIYNILVNLLSFLVTFCYKKDVITYIDESFNVLKFNILYLLLAIAIAICLPIFIEFIRKNLKIEIEMKRVKYEKSGK